VKIFIQAPRCFKYLILPLVRPLALKQPSPHTELQGVLARLAVDGEYPEAGLCLLFFSPFCRVCRLSVPGTENHPAAKEPQTPRIGGTTSKVTAYGGMKLQLPIKSPPPNMQHAAFQTEKQNLAPIICCLSALHRLLWTPASFLYSARWT
jgi:hypothetical protein